MTLPQISNGMLAAVVTSLAVAGGLSGTAVAASNCGQAVIGDWSTDGVIDHTYAPGCYTAAVRELPEDARIYSTAQSDILAALSRSVGRKAPSRLLQGAGRPVGADAGVVPATHGPSRLAAVIAALAAVGVAVLIPVRRARVRRSAQRSR